MLCFALYQASRAMTAEYRPLLEALGITYPQYLVLLVLFEDGPSSVKHLGDRLGLDSGTLSPLLKRLEVRELVVRRRSASDERSVEVSLTERGEDLRERAGCVPAQLLADVDLAGYDLDGLRSTLQQLVVDLRRSRDQRSSSSETP